MSLAKLTASFPWSRYSKKLISKIENPRSCGSFSVEEAHARQVRMVKGVAGAIAEGNALTFFWLVDPDDGIIIDAKFQLFGQTALIGAAEAACELVIGKNYDQAARISADLIDKELRDKSDLPAFPKETTPHLNLVLEALEDASRQCTDIPLATNYIAPPVPTALGEVVEGGYPGWDTLNVEKRIAVIEAVLESDVRPYIALDAGGVKVLNLVEGNKVIIAYQGSCTSCYSSIGSTLSYIQQILRNKVHPTLSVEPDSSFLNF
jgi:NifU-like protein